MQHIRSSDPLQDQPTNQPTKGLTKGGDLRQTQVDVPLSEQPFLRFNESLGSKTGTLLYNWDLLALFIVLIRDRDLVR
jgi:hypothetical protein